MKNSAELNSEELRKAIYAGNFTKVNAFIDAGRLDVTQPFAYANATIWHFLAGSNKWEYLAMLEKLLKRYHEIIFNSDILNGTAANGLTPIHWAAIVGNIRGIELLVSYGAVPTLTERRGYTAKDLLEQNGYGNLTGYLQTILDKQHELQREVRAKHQEKRPVENNLLEEPPSGRKTFEAYPNFYSWLPFFCKKPQYSIEERSLLSDKNTHNTGPTSH